MVDMPSEFARSCLAASLLFYWLSQEITLVWLYSVTGSLQEQVIDAESSNCILPAFLQGGQISQNMLISAFTAQTQAIVFES